MPALSEATGLYVGSTAVLRVMVGGTQVWPISSAAGTYTAVHVLVTATHGGTPPRLATVEFRATTGGVALTGSAYASTEDSTQTGASKAFDGDAATHWAAALGDANPRVGQSYATASAVREMVLTFANTEPFDTSGAPLDFAVIGISGTTETTLHTVTGASAWTPGETRTFTW